MSVLLNKPDIKIAYNGKIPVLNSDAPYFFTTPSNVAKDSYIDSLLKLPHTKFIEISQTNIIQTIRNFNFADADLSLSITTGTCYSGNIANCMTNAIYSRFKLDYSRKDDIKTCLHEAITNAIIHGNLQIKKAAQNFASMCQQHEEINRHLQLDYYKLKNIHINIWNNDNNLTLAVSDEGEGFEINYNATNHQLPSGRGLTIINALADSLRIDKEKRSVFIKFNH